MNRQDRLRRIRTRSKYIAWTVHNKAARRLTLWQRLHRWVAMMVGVS